MNTDCYQTPAMKPGKDLKADLKRVLANLGFTNLHLKDTKNAPDKIRWQVDCIDPSGDAMIIHGMSFMLGCIAKGMEINFRTGCVWEASATNQMPPKRVRGPKPKVEKRAGPVMDVIPWPWESNESRARNCAEFLKLHGYMEPHWYEVLLAKISRRSKTHE